ncbi:MAG: DNA polymerase IV [Thermaerobacter sp.]|nr:DNA polymerase IV [Bacillota bacterium]REJ36945.1 MAG: DNA polymerase IV [Bacillota bacterium]
MSQRTVLLCDLDAFFAAVEILDRPELAGKPVIVGHDPRSRGVVATCNYEARRYGVRSAMPMAEAVRRCPHAVIVPPRHQRYAEMSRRVMEIYARFTPLIEPVSVDEAYLDVTGRPGLRVAAAIKRAVLQETGLVVSVGVGPNKFLAKLACDLSKPDGLREIRADQARAVLAPLPVDRLPGIGPKTAARLRDLGIETAGELQRRPLQWFNAVFGSRGPLMYRLARGEDDRPLQPQSRAKSLSDEITFDRDRPAAALLPVLLACSEQVGRRLRQGGCLAHTVTIKVRFPSFVTITRSRTLPYSFDDDATIYRTARELYETHILNTDLPVDDPTGRRLIRLLGVQVSGLVDRSAPRQTTLFDPESRQRQRLHQVIDDVRRRFGERALVRGRRLHGRPRRPSHA